MSAPRPVFQAKGASKSKVPDPAKQSDRHTQLGGLLLKAEQAPDSLERMLAVCRALLCWMTDLLRPGQGFQDLAVLTLGFHALSHRDLSERHKGDPVRLYLQEGVSYEEGYGTTQHAKYDSEGSALARFKLAFTPACSVKTQRAGILGGAGAPYVECAFEGTGRLAFERHAEEYAFTLPALVFAEPLAGECPLDWDGLLSVRCAATGLAAELRFRGPGRGHEVKGTLSRLAGAGTTRVAVVKGAWSAAVEVEGMEVEGTGVLFDPSQLSPPLSTTIALAEPGPRATPRLWAAILQALTFLDPAQAAQQGKKAEQLARELPSHLGQSLGYEVEEGLRPSGSKVSREQEDPSPVPTGAGGGGQRRMPPCLEAQAQVGRRPRYFIQHLLRCLHQD